MNNFVIKKPMIPQPGKVSIHVRTISLTTPKSIADKRLTAPTPIIAVVLVCVVETGMPHTELMIKHSEAAISAEKP